MKKIKEEIKQVLETLKSIDFADDCHPGSERQAQENQESVMANLESALKATDIHDFEFWIREAARCERRGGSVAVHSGSLEAKFDNQPEDCDLCASVGGYCGHCSGSHWNSGRIHPEHQRQVRECQCGSEEQWHRCARNSPNCG